MLNLTLIGTICGVIISAALVDTRRLTTIYQHDSARQKIIQNRNQKPHIKYSKLPQYYPNSNFKHTKAKSHRFKFKSKGSDFSTKFHRKPKLEGRIVGGAWVKPEKVPYQIHIDDKGSVFCGGTLVEVYGVQVAITATHCLWTGYPDSNSTKKAEDLVVVAGDYNLKDRDYDKEQRRQVTKIAVYPGYGPRFYTHDIAILFLQSEFQYTQYVEAAILPEYNWDQPKYVKISGWGSNSFGAGLQNFLQYIELPILKLKVCLEYNAFQYVDITDHQFCVGSYDGNPRGTCSGDSGGPGIGLNKTSNKWYLAGVVSFGVSKVCGSPWFPTVFTKVSKYVDWIRIEVSDYIQANGIGRK